MEVTRNMAIAASQSRKERQFWLNQFAHSWEKSHFPYDFEKAAPGTGMEAVEFEIAEELFARIMKISSRSDSRIHMICIAAAAVLLHRFTRNNDIIIGIPVDKQDIDGELINTALALRNTVEPHMSFKELLLMVRKTVLQTAENQNYPIEVLLYDLELTASETGFPLFDVVVLLENIQDKHYLRDINVNTVFSFLRTGKSLRAVLEYNPRRYHEATAVKISRHFQELLARVLGDVNKKIGEIDILLPGEKKTLLEDFNNTRRGCPGDKVLHTIFEEQVERTPDSIAVTGKTPGLAPGAVTYKQLNQRSNQLAHILRNKSVKADSLVMLIMERSIDMIIGILGILKAGGAYLPIDVNYPKERINYMLADSAPGILLTKRDYSKEIRFGKEIIYIWDAINSTPFSRPRRSPWINAPAASLAYVIYTSGSTGNPKGVLIRHRSVVNMVWFHREVFAENDRSRFSQVASASFDAMAFEIWPCLLAGAALCMVDHETATDPRQLKKWIIKHQITISFQPTPMAERLLEEEWPKPATALKALRAAGDKLNRYPKSSYPFRFYNLYGPTEDTIWTTWTEVPFNTSSETKPPSIGKPAANKQVYILSRGLKLQPVGTAGELCISGEGLARGYLNRPQLTAEKFDQDLWDYRDYHDKKAHELHELTRIGTTLNIKFLRESRGQFFQKAPPGRRRPRIYKTGDLARWLEEGNIEFLGRIDYQVKIMGCRIELGEIENQLLKYEHIKAAVVMARETQKGGKYLCAYIIPYAPGSSPTDMQLRDYLGRSLPDYMIPAYFLILDRLPLTHNGKIDRKQLPPPEDVVNLEYTAPRDELEKTLVEIWQKELNLQQVGINDNYFNIGGDSIKSVRLINIINKELNKRLKIADLYANNTIARLADRIKQGDTDLSPVNKQYETALTKLEEIKNKYLLETDIMMTGLKKENIEDIYPMSHIEIGMVYYSLKNPGTEIYHNQMVFQRSLMAFDHEHFKKTMMLLLEKHPILRTVFDLDSPGEPVQIVLKTIPTDIRHYDISHLQTAEQEEFIQTKITKDRQKPFEFNIKTINPLWRIKTFLVNDHRIFFLWVCHHAILDGWSSASLVTELNNTYLELKNDPGFVPEKLKSSYKDFIIHQVIEKEKKKSPEYWKSELAGYKRLEFPGAPALLASKGEPVPGKGYSLNLGQSIVEQMNHAAVKYNTSLKHLCFAAYIYMLNMFSYESDIVAGLVTGSRPACEDGDKIIGCFLNTVPVRVRIPIHTRWQDYIRLVDEKLIEVSAYDHMPLFEIVRIIGEKAEDRNPLFDTIFNFVDFHVYRDLNPEEPGESNRENSPGKRLPSVTTQSHTNTLLDFGISTTGGELFVGISYSNLALSDEMVEKCIGYFQKVLEKFIHEPGNFIIKNDLVSLEDKEKLLCEFNNTKVTYPENRTIHRLFSRQAEQTPDNIAVVGPLSGKYRTHTTYMTYISYQELNKQSNQMAHRLKEKGVKQDTIAAIMVERSIEMVTGILAILKAGGAYMPIEPDYPPERKQYMLEDSGARVLLASPGARVKVKAEVKENSRQPQQLLLQLINIDPELVSAYDPPLSTLTSTSTCQVSPANLAYIIYTSGSTGWPRGVMVEHLSVLNILYALQEAYPLGETDTYLLKTPYIFDVSVAELFGWFFAGGRLAVLEPGEEKDPEAILAAIQRHRVTHINFVPSMFHIFAAGLDTSNVHALSGLRYIFLAGEALLPQTIKRFNDLNTAIVLENIYGPTEGTVYSSSYPLSWGLRRDKIPIGKPMPNTRLYILDRLGALQPPGIVGELCISGIGVARGYLNNPELTAQKFNQDLWDYQDYRDEKQLAAKTREDTRRREDRRHITMTDDRFSFRRRRLKPVQVRRTQIPLTINNSQLTINNSSLPPITPSPHYPIYLTGDLASWLPDGNIEFIGRIDNQLKLRGYRIELGEIENVLMKHDHIKEAVVLSRSKGKADQYLCAYIVTVKEFGISELREYLAKRLPEYMIPSYLMQVEKIPLTYNGKIDRNALPEPEIIGGSEYAAPRDEIEKELAGIWREVLGVKAAVGIDDNFFELGGHSLKATILVARIHKKFDIKLPLAAIFKTPRIKGLAESIKAMKEERFASIEPVEKKEYYLLSSAQQRLYILQQVELTSTAYNMSSFIPLREEPDIKKLTDTCKCLIHRHESLRTSFESVEDQPVQKVHDKVKFEIEYHNFARNWMMEVEQTTEETPGTHLSSVIRHLSSGFIRPFDLSGAPLLRIALLKINTGYVKFLLMVDIHHIISDGTSHQVLAKELAAIDKGETLPLLRLQYKDFSEWQNSNKEMENLKQQELYWLKEFDGQIPLLDMPTDYKRSNELRFEGRTLSFKIVPPLTGKLIKMASQFNITLMMLLLSGYNILLSKYTGQEDLVVGTVTAGRRHADLENIMGFFVNMLAIRTKPGKNKRFSEYLSEVKEKILNALENQDYQFEELVSKLQVQRVPGRHPLIDTVFVLVDDRENLAEQEKQPTETNTNDPDTNFFEKSHFDLMLHATVTKHSINMVFEYSTRLFKETTILELSKYYLDILHKAAANKDIKLQEIKVSHDLQALKTNSIKDDKNDWNL